MSQNGERLRKHYSEWAQGNFSGAGRDLFAPDAVLVPPLSEVEYRSEELGSYFRRLYKLVPLLGDAFGAALGRCAEFRVEAQDLLEGDEAIVVVEQHHCRGKDGVETPLTKIYSIWTFAKGRVTKVQWEMVRTRAMEAAGVREQSDAWYERYSPTAGLPFDDLELESRIVWIWGSPRTGSTWLLRQICHPAQLDPGLPLGFGLPPGSADELQAVPYDEFVISSHTAPTTGGRPGRVGDAYLPETLNTFAGNRNSYVFAERFADVWGPELRRLTLVRLGATLDRASGLGVALAQSPLLVIKEVNGSQAADRVMRLFPRSKLLFLVRDGRDVIDSLMHAYGSWMDAPPQLQRPEERLAWVREACLDWASKIDIVRFAFEFHPPELRLELRYEDLLADTGSRIRALFEWLGLPADRERVDEVVAAHSFQRIPADQRGASKPERFAQPGLWRKNLSAEEQAVAAEIMGPRLAALGYKPA
jgi:Sulfotransferase family